jgi:hypothetical protein
VTDEELLRALEQEIAALKEQVKILTDLMLDHISQKSEIEKFREKLNEYR